MDTVNQAVSSIVPDALASRVPFARRISTHSPSHSRNETYFCNICFQYDAVSKGFFLRDCGHQFCTECIKGFLTNKIESGVVNIHCFHPLDRNVDDPNDDTVIPGACGQLIAEEDIHQIVDKETWDKYNRFKANLENTLSRQCPYCQYTQIGDPSHPIMKCENTECGKSYCLYHSNAHPIEMKCEDYELSIAQETKMNEMTISEMKDEGNCKPCPQCNFIVLKSGGCNHMTCPKCRTSFCWLCLQIIGKQTIPEHYRDPNSQCHGKQFDGMEGERPPQWLIVLLTLVTCIFCIPSSVLGGLCGICCLPMLCSCCDLQDEDGNPITFEQILVTCIMFWMLLFAMIFVFCPIVIVACIVNCVRGCMCCGHRGEGDGDDGEPAPNPDPDGIDIPVLELQDDDVHDDEDEEKKEDGDQSEEFKQQEFEQQSSELASNDSKPISLPTTQEVVLEMEEHKQEKQSLVNSPK